MTLNERFVKERAWLKTDHFAVTHSLRAELQASALPVQEQQRYAYIQNKVVHPKGTCLDKRVGGRFGA